MGPPGAAAPAWKRQPGRTSPMARISRLKAPAISGKLIVAKQMSFPGSPDMQARRLGGLVLYGFGVSASCESGRTRSQFRAHGKRGAIISRLHPAWLRLSGRPAVSDLSPAE